MSAHGYEALLAWARGFGPVLRAGVEGTGAWGAGLTRFLLAEQVAVVEVIRPVRRDRRQRGKSDPIDAEAAARSVLNGTATNQAKTRDGRVESIRALKLTRDSAVKSRVAALGQLHSLVVTAPQQLRADLQQLRLKDLIAGCARFRPAGLNDPLQGIKYALRSLAAAEPS